jgi:hypothetical protein
VSLPDPRANGFSKKKKKKNDCFAIARTRSIINNKRVTPFTDKAQQRSACDCDNIRPRAYGLLFTTQWSTIVNSLSCASFARSRDVSETVTRTEQPPTRTTEKYGARVLIEHDAVGFRNETAARVRLSIVLRTRVRTCTLAEAWKRTNHIRYWNTAVDRWPDHQLITMSSNNYDDDDDNNNNNNNRVIGVPVRARVWIL